MDKEICRLDEQYDSLYFLKQLRGQTPHEDSKGPNQAQSLNAGL